MDFRIELGVLETFVLYASTVVIATLLAAHSKKVRVANTETYRNLSSIFILSFVVLALPLIFRASGVDNEGYLEMYREISMWNGNFLQNYRGFPEPLFMLLNYFVIVTTDNFQFVYIISGIISLFFLYKAFKRKIEELDPGILIWLFSSTLYFYMYGLVRMLIAVSIMTYALHYLENRNIKKYLVWGLIAGFFHYSAFIIIPIFVVISLVSSNKSVKFNLFKSALISIVVIPSIFTIGMIVFKSLFYNFAWFGRYSKYFNFDNINIQVLKNIVWILPLFVILIVYGKYIEKHMSSFKLHANLLFVMLTIALLSVFFGVQRLLFYIYPSVFYLYTSFIRLPFIASDKNSVKLFYWLGMLFMGNLWLFNVVIGGENWRDFMVPYIFHILR